MADSDSSCSSEFQSSEDEGSDCTEITTSCAEFELRETRRDFAETQGFSKP